MPLLAVPDAHLKCMSTHHLEGLDQLISIDELSDYLGVPKTIYDWRLTGHGPCAIRVGRHLKDPSGGPSRRPDCSRDKVGL